MKKPKKGRPRIVAEDAMPVASRGVTKWARDNDLAPVVATVIRAHVDGHKGNIYAAASTLGVTAATIYNRIARWDDQ